MSGCSHFSNALLFCGMCWRRIAFCPICVKTDDNTHKLIKATDHWSRLPDVGRIQEGWKQNWCLLNEERRNSVCVCCWSASLQQKAVTGMLSGYQSWGDANISLRHSWRRGWQPTPTPVLSNKHSSEQWECFLILCKSPACPRVRNTTTSRL